jgi:hypothetical protein
MSNVTYFNYARARKLLKSSAVKVFVLTDPAKREVTPFNVGYDLKPAMNLQVTPEAIECIMHFKGIPQQVRIEWSAVLMIQPLTPPPGTNTPAPGQIRAA